MKIEQGKQAVWRHLGEAGMQDDIKLISKYFDINEINLFTPECGGKLTYIEQRMPKQHRVCVATKTSETTKDVISRAKGGVKRWKK